MLHPELSEKLCCLSKIAMLGIALDHCLSEPAKGVIRSWNLLVSRQIHRTKKLVQALEKFGSFHLCLVVYGLGSDFGEADAIASLIFCAVKRFIGLLEQG